MEVIDSKTKMYKLLRSGKLGNTIKTFNSLEEACISDLNWVGARYSDRSINGKNFVTIISPKKLKAKINSFIAQGANLDNFIFSETDKEYKDKLLIQGEIGEIGGNFELAYSCVIGITNREASNRGYKRITGLLARMMLKYYMWAEDYDWIFKLLNNYPEHIIEFSTFSIPVGNILNRNTIIWEVRKY